MNMTLKKRQRLQRKSQEDLANFLLGINDQFYSYGWGGTVLSDGTEIINYDIIADPDFPNLTDDKKGDLRFLPYRSNDTMLINKYQQDMETVKSPTGEDVYKPLPGKGVYGVATLISNQMLILSTAATEKRAGADNVVQMRNPYSLVSYAKDNGLISFDYIADGDSLTLWRENHRLDKEDAYYTPALPSGYESGNGVAVDMMDDQILYLSNSWRLELGTDNVFHRIYGPSKVTLLPVLDRNGAIPATPVAEVEGAKNVNSMTVSGDFVYVTSIGGEQVPGGNPNAKLEIFQKVSTGSGSALFLKNTITTSMLPEDANAYGKTGDFMGVKVVTLVDTATGEEKKYAVILLARYDANYTNYTFQVFRVPEENLQQGSLADAKWGTSVLREAGPTWGLLQDETDELYIVEGTKVSKLDPVTLTHTNFVKAADFAVSGHTGATFNTAGIVTAATGVSSKLRFAANVSISVTQMAHSILPPHVLEEVRVKARKAAEKKSF